MDSQSVHEAIQEAKKETLEKVKKAIDDRKQLHKLRCIGLKGCSLCYLLKQIERDLRRSHK